MAVYLRIKTPPHRELYVLVHVAVLQCVSAHVFVKCVSICQGNFTTAYKLRDCFALSKTSVKKKERK